MTDATEGPTERVKRGVSRRQLLAGGASASGALALAGVLGHSATADSSGTSAPTLMALNAQEAALFGAMADRVFPSDDGTPGASDLGFVQYLDGQLDGSWGTGAGLYHHGPFHEPTSSGMGYQLRLVPKDLYKQVAATIDAHAQQSAGGAFHTLSAAQQDTIMTDLETGKVDLGLATSENGYTSASFFAEFLQRVNEALFADPMYGGNKNVGGWEWIGYPGNPMAYGDAYWTIFPHQDDPYNVPPKPLSAGSDDGLPMSQSMPGMEMNS
jgi:gluconate 2-dehydrogenase gamma chain